MNCMLGEVLCPGTFGLTRFHDRNGKNILFGFLKGISPMYAEYLPRRCYGDHLWHRPLTGK